jgi:type 1 glutamine amidotransferase
MPGGTFPLGWTRQYGNGKVFVLLLGHDGQSFKTPEFQKIVLNGVDWATTADKRVMD